MTLLTKRSLALVLCLSTLACTQNQVFTTLEAAVDAAVAADEVLRPQDGAYLGLVTECLDNSEAILETTASAAIKAAEIASTCAAAVAAGKIGGPAIQAVVAALNAFLQAVAAGGTSGAAEQLQPNNRIRVKINSLKAKLKAQPNGKH